MQQPGNLACFALEALLLLPSRPALEAETGANLTSLARLGPGAERPTTRFKTQSVHSHTKRYEGASGLSRLHHWRESTPADGSWRRPSTCHCACWVPSKTVNHLVGMVNGHCTSRNYSDYVHFLNTSPNYALKGKIWSAQQVCKPRRATPADLAAVLGIQTRKSCICAEPSRPASKHAACTTNIEAQALPLP